MPSASEKTKLEPFNSDAEGIRMETPQEYASTQIRRFMTVLFIERARSHLKVLAVEYGWSPERLLEYEIRFIKQAELVPTWI
jgi:hypothetical protein